MDQKLNFTIKLAIVYILLIFATVWAGGMSSKSIPGFQLDPKLVDGNEAVPHSIPYQVGIIATYLETSVFCSGSLISQKYVLTAASCVSSAQSVKVVLGAHNLSNEDEAARLWFNADVSKIVVHKDWVWFSLFNDIAVVELLQEITLSDAIKIVDLPKRSEVDNYFEDETAKVSGWGVNGNSNDRRISPVLLYSDVLVLNNSLCTTSSEEIVQKNHICTSGKGGKSTGKHDAGSPLVVDNQQIGIAISSSVLPDGSYFTRVTTYLDWIEENTDVKILN